MNIEILSFSESETVFQDFQRRQFRSLAQHTWGWQNLLNSWEGLQWNCVSLEHEGEILGLLPFCVKRTQIGAVAMSSPLPASYSGVLHIGECNFPIVYKELLSAWINWGKENKVDILSIFSSPFRDDICFYREYFGPDYVIEKFYQFLPGSFDFNTISHSKFRNNLKRNLKKAEENGLKSDFFSVPEPHLFDEWYNSVLCERFNDISASPAPPEFYKKILSFLGPIGNAEFGVVKKDNEILGGGIFLYGWCEDIFIRAAKSTSLKMGTGVYLDFEALNQGRKKQANSFNFQSSPSKFSPTYEYKKNWGCSEDNTYYLVKIVGQVESFVKAGIEQIKKDFPYFFVLPFSCFGQKGV